MLYSQKLSAIELIINSATSQSAAQATTLNHSGAPDNKNDSGSAKLPPGTIVFDKFEIISYIAEGGMGAVYKARDLARDCTIALKLIRHSCVNPVTLLRFQSEAKTASKLNHPNIASVFDFGCSKDGNSAYLSMEYVEGETLQSALKRMKVLEFSDLLTLLEQVGSALLHAHRAGIIHRDIKPANLIVRFDNERQSLKAKLLDFGIAKSSDELTALTVTGAIIGSPLYMSPEQCKGLPLTKSSDVYSLGCVIWECLTGAPPFQGETVLETMTLHQRETLPELSIALPEEFVAVLKGMLHKDPVERASLENDVLPLLEELSARSSAKLAVDASEDKPIDTTSGVTKKKQLAFFAVIGALALSFSLVSVSRDDKRPESVQSPSANLSDARETPHGLAELELPAPETLLDRPDGTTEYANPENASDEKIDELTKVPQRARRIVSISVPNSPVTDRVFSSLARCTNLTELNLLGSQVTTLAGVKRLRKLNSLDLALTRVDDRSVSNLAGSRELKKLSLKDTAVSDEALPELVQLPLLETLDLSKTKITGKTLPSLTGLKSLNRVLLNYCEQLKVDGVSTLLASSESLKSISLKGSPRFSQKVIESLRNEFPLHSVNDEKSVYHNCYESGQKAESSGNDEAALKNFQQAIAILEKHEGPKSRSLPALYSTLARISVRMKNWQNAKRYLSRAKSLAAKAKDPESEACCADVESELILQSKGAGEAAASFDRTHKLLKKMAIDPETYLQQWGDKFAIAKDPQLKLALKLYEESVELRQKKHGKQSPESTESMCGVMYCYLKTGRIDAAMACKKRILSILENADLKSPSSRRLTAYSYARLAEIDNDRGEFDSAIAYSARACNVASRETPDCLMNCLNLRVRLLGAHKANSPELNQAQAMLNNLTRVR